MKTIFHSIRRLKKYNFNVDGLSHRSLCHLIIFLLWTVYKFKTVTTTSYLIDFDAKTSLLEVERLLFRTIVQQGKHCEWCCRHSRGESTRPLWTLWRWVRQQYNRHFPSTAGLNSKLTCTDNHPSMAKCWWMNWSLQDVTFSDTMET